MKVSTILAALALVTVQGRQTRRGFNVFNRYDGIDQDRVVAEENKVGDQLDSLFPTYQVQTKNHHRHGKRHQKAKHGIDDESYDTHFDNLDNEIWSKAKASNEW